MHALSSEETELEMAAYKSHISVTKTHSFKRIMSFRTGGSGSRRSHNSVEFVQGNLTAGTANGSVRPMQFGFLGQVGFNVLISYILEKEQTHQNFGTYILI